MTITINKGGKDYEFKYSRENSKVTLSSNDPRQMIIHKWTCKELPKDAEGNDCEVFFGDYDNTTESIAKIQKTAEKGIEKLPQVAALTAADERANETVSDAVIEEEKPVDPTQN